MSAAGGDTDLIHVKNGTAASQCFINRPPVKRSVDYHLEQASSPVLGGRRFLSMNSGLDLFDLFMKLGAVHLIASMIRKRIPYFSKTKAKARRPGVRTTQHNDCIYYYSQSRIEKLVGLITTLIIFILLVLPIVAIYKLTSVGNSTFDAVGILVVWKLFFSAVISLLTKAKRHKLFAASAAYCAVLVVFHQQFQ